MRIIKLYETISNKALGHLLSHWAKSDRSYSYIFEYKLAYYLRHYSGKKLRRGYKSPIGELLRLVQANTHTSSALVQNIEQFLKAYRYLEHKSQNLRPRVKIGATK